MVSSGNYYVINEHEDEAQYGPYAIPSKLSNSYDTIIMCLIYMKSKVSLACVQYHPR